MTTLPTQIPTSFAPGAPLLEGLIAAGVLGGGESAPVENLATDQAGDTITDQAGNTIIP